MRGYKIDRDALITLIFFLLLGAGLYFYAVYRHDHPNCENGSAKYLPISKCPILTHHHHR